MKKLVFIFLDVDGVLNNERHISKCYRNNGNHSMHMNHVPFDPKCLQNLMKLVRYIENKQFTVRIILSSTWRLHEVDYEIVNARLAEYGLRLFDKTKYIHCERGVEILDYLHTCKEQCCFYLILDDDVFDIVTNHNNLNIITTSFNYGFNKHKLYQAKHKFKKYLKEVSNGNYED